MKKHNTIKVVLITILVLVLLTWILPAAYFSSSYIEQGRIQVGLFDLFNYPMTALSYFGHIALYLLVVGAFYGILYKIPAYRTFLDRIAFTLKKNGKLSLVIIMILLAVITSICGLQIGLIVFFPMLVSVILLMGYDKVVAALTLAGSTMIGMAGSTYAYSNSSISLSVLGLDISSQILTKFIILVLGLILLIFNTILYIRKSSIVKINDKKVSTKSEKSKEEVIVDKKETGKTASKKTSSKTSKSTKSTKTSKSTKSSKSSKKDIKAALKDEDIIVVKDVAAEDVSYIPEEANAKQSIWPFVVSFAILFVILIFAFVSWANAFNLSWFTDANTAISEFKLFGFNIFGKLLGTVNEFGSWSVIDVIVVLFLITVLLTVIYKVSFDDVLDGFMKGMKKALPLAILVILIYTCLVIATYHPFQLVIYKAIIGLSKKVDLLCAFTSSLVSFLAGLFNVESAYAFQSVLPYFASVITDAAKYPIIDVIFQSMYGFTMLLAPTSVVLMTVLSYLDIPYGKWLKTIWKLLVEFLVVLLIIFAVLVLL